MAPSVPSGPFLASTPTCLIVTRCYSFWGERQLHSYHLTWFRNSEDSEGGPSLVCSPLPAQGGAPLKLTTTAALWLI